MSIIKDFADKYHKERDKYDIKIEFEDNIIEKRREQIATAERAIIRAKKRRSKIDFPYWTELIIENIAKAMLEYFPEGYVYKILGPFGISSSTSIWINHPDWDINKNQILHITDLHLLLIYLKKLNQHYSELITLQIQKSMLMELLDI